MTEEIIIDECFNCKKKKDIGDNWRTCKLKCSYKYKRKENDYITRLEQENEALAFRERLYKADYEASEQENKELKKENERLKTLYRNEGITDICEACSIASAMEAYDYRSALEEIREIVTSAFAKQRPYKEDFAEIETKINEVLNLS